MVTRLNITSPLPRHADSIERHSHAALASGYRTDCKPILAEVRRETFRIVECLAKHKAIRIDLPLIAGKFAKEQGMRLSQFLRDGRRII